MFLKKEKEEKPNILKCPYCGEILKLNDYKCPACGNEIINDEYKPAIEEFSMEIGKLKKTLPNYTKKSFKSWRGSNKFWWIFLNIFTLCAPIVIRNLIYKIHLEDNDNFTNADENIVNYIKNYNIPNNPNDYFDILHFIKKELIELKENNNDKSCAFAKIWKNKANEIKQSAINNNIINSKISLELNEIEIVANEIKKIQKKKIIIATLILLAYIIAIFLIYLLRDKGE